MKINWLFILMEFSSTTEYHGAFGVLLEDVPAPLRQALAKSITKGDGHVTAPVKIAKMNRPQAKIKTGT